MLTQQKSAWKAKGTHTVDIKENSTEATVQDAEPTAAETTESTANTPAPPDTAHEATGDATNGAGGTDEINRLNAALQKVRAEAAENRVKKNAAIAERDELQNHFARLATTEGEPPAAILERMTAERDTTTAELNTLRTELAVRAAADKAGADYTILGPYLNGTGELAKLDPTASDYTAQVAKLVADTVKTLPQLKRAQAAPASGPQEGTRESDQKITRDQLSTMTAAEINRAVKAGKLKHLTG